MLLKLGTWHWLALDNQLGIMHVTCAQNLFVAVMAIQSRHVGLTDVISMGHPCFPFHN